MRVCVRAGCVFPMRVVCVCVCLRALRAYDAQARNIGRRRSHAGANLFQEFNFTQSSPCAFTSKPPTSGEPRLVSAAAAAAAMAALSLWRYSSAHTHTHTRVCARNNNNNETITSDALSLSTTTTSSQNQSVHSSEINFLLARIVFISRCHNCRRRRCCCRSQWETLVRVRVRHPTLTTSKGLKHGLCCEQNSASVGRNDAVGRRRRLPSIRAHTSARDKQQICFRRARVNLCGCVLACV